MKTSRGTSQARPSWRRHGNTSLWSYTWWPPCRWPVLCSLRCGKNGVDAKEKLPEAHEPYDLPRPFGPRELPEPQASAPEPCTPLQEQAPAEATRLIEHPVYFVSTSMRDARTILCNTNSSLHFWSPLGSCTITFKAITSRSSPRTPYRKCCTALTLWGWSMNGASSYRHSCWCSDHHSYQGRSTNGFKGGVIFEYGTVVTPRVK